MHSVALQIPVLVQMIFIFVCFDPKKPDQELERTCFFSLPCVCSSWWQIFREWIPSWSRRVFCFYLNNAQIKNLSPIALSWIGNLRILEGPILLSSIRPISHLKKLRVHSFPSNHDYVEDWSSLDCLKSLSFETTNVRRMNKRSIGSYLPNLPPNLTSLTLGIENGLWYKDVSIDFRCYQHLGKLRIDWQNCPSILHMPPHLSSLTIMQEEIGIVPFDTVKLVELQCPYSLLYSHYYDSFSFPRLKKLILRKCLFYSYPRQQMPSLTHLVLEGCSTFHFLPMQLTSGTHLEIVDAGGSYSAVDFHCSCPNLTELTFRDSLFYKLRFDTKVLPQLSKITLDGSFLRGMDISDWKQTLPLLTSIEYKGASSVYVTKKEWCSDLYFQIIPNEISKKLAPICAFTPFNQDVNFLLL